MQGRSWMAALTLVAGIALSLVDRALADDTVVVGDVRLDLAIAGLSAKGCDVEIKPGHAGCKFKALKTHIEQHGEAHPIFKNVEVTGSDHDCAFTITVKESGHPDKIIHRGLRLTPPQSGKASQPSSLSCLISSPSKIAAAERARTRR